MGAGRAEVMLGLGFYDLGSKSAVCWRRLGRLARDIIPLKGWIEEKILSNLLIRMTLVGILDLVPRILGE